MTFALPIGTSSATLMVSWTMPVFAAALNALYTRQEGWALDATRPKASNNTDKAFMMILVYYALGAFFTLIKHEEV
jgi:hypothetical protein